MLASVAITAHAKGDLRKVNHVIIVMQENHSFDNYFGVLPYVPRGPYHAGPCARGDHRCVDGLACEREGSSLDCRNWNLDADAPSGMKRVRSFKLANYCPEPDLNHGWAASHQEANFNHPTNTLRDSPNDGFVRVNDATEQIDTGESNTEDETMGYYDDGDLPFYYGLAQTFAISDRYFSSVIGPTFPNRAYTLAATSFGHLTTAEIIPPPSPPFGGYRPITGTILDLLDGDGVSWKDFLSNVPSTGIFRGADPTHLVPLDDRPVAVLSLFAPPKPGVCTLPAVSFVDSFFGLSAADIPLENDEHPPSSIKKGESFVSQIVNVVRNSACWDDSVIFITYDEHGGFYDHVAPARAPQGGAPNPDGIDPGLCADESAPPLSEQPGFGANCAVSKIEGKALCPEFDPTAPFPTYPASCPNFDQLGFRVPFMAVSPFSKPQYVSHVVADHTSMLAFIEKRFLGSASEGERQEEDDDGEPGQSRNGRRARRQHLTLRDLYASTLEDLFDFDKAPSKDAPVPPSEEDSRCRSTP
ncbi:MAG: hypothetical protein AUH38_03180 [Deltaproteobacteria bacterium 13_1_40CM_68_24]|nr:MAG: hypothetical protein AUH38_03180 [Deltaproteobacteria bacterium 13_1_40CM_68_24]